MKLIQDILKKIGSSIEPCVSGDGLNSIPIGQTIPAAGAFTTLKASTDPTDDNGVGDRGYNDTRYLISAIPMDTVTDPALNAAVSTAIIDVYGGIIITLTAAGNAQTLQSPTDTTAGKRFVVVTDDGNGANTIEVNGITMSAGEAQRFIWDGSAWMPITAVDADDISFTPAGNIVATDVQAAIEELDTEKVGPATIDTLTNKSIDGDNNTITNLPTSSLGNTIREANSLDLAQAIFDRCTDPRLIMVADQEPGAELITNGKDWTGATGATPPTGWSANVAAIYTATVDGGPSGTGDTSLKIEVDATPTGNPAMKSTFATVIGESYTFSYWFKGGTAATGELRLGSTEYGSQYTYDYPNDANWTYYQHTFIATSTTTYIFVQVISSTTGQFEEFDLISCTLTCKDYSSKGHDGIFQGAMTSGDRIDQGSIFMYDPDGSDDYINFGDDDDFSYDDSGATPFSVGGVVEVAAGVAIQTIIGKWDSGNTLREWKLHLTALEEARMSLYDESADTEPFVESAALSAGKHLIICTYDGSGGNDADDGLNMYIDGVLDNTDKSSTVGYTAMEPSLTALTVGCSLNNGVAAEVFDGDVGYQILTPELLSAADVWNLWLQVKSKYGL